MLINGIVFPCSSKDVIRIARVAAIKNICIVKNTSNYRIKKDVKNGKIIVSKKHQ